MAQSINRPAPATNITVLVGPYTIAYAIIKVFAKRRKIFPASFTVVKIAFFSQVFLYPFGTCKNNCAMITKIFCPTLSIQKKNMTMCYQVAEIFLWVLTSRFWCDWWPYVDNQKLIKIKNESERAWMPELLLFCPRPIFFREVVFWSANL